MKRIIVVTIASIAYCATAAFAQQQLTYPVVATGQIACYNIDGEVIAAPKQGDALYGQDGNYQTGLPMSYRDNGDGTVTDLNTGLIWEKSPAAGAVTWSQAEKYCEELELGGYSDWRLPTLKELFSISDFSVGWPYINSVYFDLSSKGRVDKDEQFWAAERYVGETVEGRNSAAFGVNHATGHIKAYASGDSMGGGRRGGEGETSREGGMSRGGGRGERGENSQLAAGAPGQGMQPQGMGMMPGGMPQGMPEGMPEGGMPGGMGMGMMPPGMMQQTNLVEGEPLPMDGEPLNDSIPQRDMMMGGGRPPMDGAPLNDSIPQGGRMMMGGGRPQMMAQGGQMGGQQQGGQQQGRQQQGRQQRGGQQQGSMMMSNPMQKRVRAVRGSIYGENNFEVNNDGTITDRATALMWSTGDNGEGIEWEEALQYAEASTLAGYSDWRLPNVKELQSIVDYTRAPSSRGVEAAIDPIFSCTPFVNEAGDDDFGYYWTSTSACFRKNAPFYFAWYVAFGKAVNSKGADFHGAGAVRFDSKSDNGLEVEGGEERYYNFVRLVRNIE